MQTISNTHAFNVNIACELGVECAVVYYDITYYLANNIDNNKHFHDGYHWMYNSFRAFESHFPYFNAKKISRILKKLEDSGYLITGNFNKVQFDKTKWYASPIFEEEYFRTKKSRDGGGSVAYKSANDIDGITQQVRTGQGTLFDVPEEQKNNHKNKKTYENEIKEVIDFLNSKVNRNFKPDTGQTVTDLTRWFKKGYKVEDIKQMISFKVNQWKGTDNEQWLIPSTLFRKSNFEGYVEASQGYQDFVSYAERGCINV